jgi:hypothetical protein
MANKTLKDMFPEYSLSDNKDEEQTEQPETTATREAKKAASELISILEEDKRKDHRCVFRLNKKAYYQFSTICKKKGVTTSAILQMFIADFIRENEHLLDE